MNTKIVYGVVCEYGDKYYGQLFVSVISLKKYNPDVRIELVVDRLTNDTLVACQAEIKSLVDNVIVVETPIGFGKIQRAQYIKTNMRHFIEGDFLFLDTDTIICGTLEEVDLFDGEIMAVLDMHVPNGLSPKNMWLYRDVETVGWTFLNGEDDYNSGVFYVKDTPFTRNFYTKWYELWLECNSKGVVFCDQLPLTRLNQEYGHIIKELAGVWNCQARFDNGIEYLPQAKILHFFGSLARFGYDHPLTRDSVYQEIRDTGRLSPYMMDLLDTPRCFLVKESDVQLIASSFNRVRYISPIVYKILEKIAGWVCGIKVCVSRIKR